MFKRVRYGLVVDGARAYSKSVAARMVLIIAEDPLAREVYAELFAMRGWDVTTAANAREALKSLRRRRFSTAVISMQSGGAQLRKQLHTIRPSLRVHVTGLMMPLPFDIMTPSARQQLH